MLLMSVGYLPINCVINRKGKSTRERERGGGGRRGRWDYHPINYPIHAVKYVYSLRPVIRFINSLALAGKIIMPSD
jgi:hypothetical protein